MRDPNSTKGTWDATFDPCFVRNRAAVTWEAKLREKGAFYHPNVYSSDGSANDFKNWGDYLGYNTIVTSNIVSTLTREVPGGGGLANRENGETAFYGTTWLYYLVRHQNLALDAHGTPVKAAFQAIATMLDECKTLIDTAAAVNRAALSAELAAKLDVIQGGHALGYTSDHPYRNRYWLWPNLSEEQDVYDVTCVGGWEHLMRATSPHFHIDLDLSNRVLDDTQGANMNYPDCDLTRRLNPPAGMETNMIKCAVNFVNMLAWRLWSDRSIPMHKVFKPRQGIWGDFDKYIHRPVEYSNSLPVGALLLGLGPDPKGFPGGHGGDGGLDAMERTEATQNIEVVIVRPNIEHYMLGIILGQGGESLGSTFWGQTELSCYDDSMHGIWGM
jgi:hypothetical protein